jgi:hypothetical protein
MTACSQDLSSMAPAARLQNLQLDGGGNFGLDVPFHSQNWLYGLNHCLSAHRPTFADFWNSASSVTARGIQCKTLERRSGLQNTTCEFNKIYLAEVNIKILTLFEFLMSVAIQHYPRVWWVCKNRGTHHTPYLTCENKGELESIIPPDNTYVKEWQWLTLKTKVSKFGAA